MLKTIVDFLNAILLDLAQQRWIKRLMGPLLPEIGFLDVSPQLRIYLALQDMKGPSFHLLNKRSAGYTDYEKTLREDLLKFLPEDGVLFDVGSNIGLISFWTALARPRGRVYAFEPEPLNFLIMNKTKLHNRIGNVELIPLGLGEKAGLETFFLDQDNHGGHSLDQSQVHNEAVPCSVLISTVDAMADTLSLARVDAIKIDVQGLELAVLKGAKKSIERFKPILAVEFMFNEKFNDGFLKFFSELSVNYKFCEPGESELRDISELKTLVPQKKAQGYFYGDFFFVPAK